MCQQPCVPTAQHADSLAYDVFQLKASTDLLRQAHPLKHVAPVRKSQVQHALCEVLAAMLANNVKADLPRLVYTLASHQAALLFASNPFLVPQT